MSRQKQRTQSADILIQTALKLFSEKGYDKTSIRSIATEAGVSLGLMYNYFSGKEELLLEIFRRGNEDVMTSLAAPTAPGPESGSIERYIRQTVRVLKEKRDFWRLLHSLRLQNEVVQEVMLELQEQVRTIETAIREKLTEAGIPFPDLEAKLLFASIDGMANHYLMQENYPVDDVATLLIMKYK